MKIKFMSHKVGSEPPLLRTIDHRTAASNRQRSIVHDTSIYWPPIAPLFRHAKHLRRTKSRLGLCRTAPWILFVWWKRVRL